MDFPYKNVDDYLNALGVLDNGTPKAIEMARKEYRRLYLLHYKRGYAQSHSNVTISFTKTDKKQLQELAKGENKRLASFIKDKILPLLSSKTDSQISDINMIEIQRLLSLCLDVVEELLFEGEYPRLQQSIKQIEGLLHSINAIMER